MNLSSINSVSPAMLTDLSAVRTGQPATPEVAQEFESLILSQILKQMRQPTEEGGGMFPGDNSDTYGGMFDMYFGKFLAQNGGLGLADFITQNGGISGSV
ncbi:MAG: rod-binding protein [Planctomycetaceae bacterium]